MTEFDSSETGENRFIHYFQRSQNARPWQKGVHYCALGDAVLQILLLLGIIIAWIVSIIVSIVRQDGTFFGLMCATVFFCLLQLVLAMFLVHASAKEKPTRLKLWAIIGGIHLGLILILTILGYSFQLIGLGLLIFVIIMILFRIVQILVVLNFRNQILDHENNKSTIVQVMSALQRQT